MGASVNHPQPLLIKEGSRASQTQVYLAAGTCAVSKRSKLGFNARVERSIWVRFSFVFNVPFFVFNDILASVVSFFVFFGPRSSRVPGLLCFSSRSEACPRQCVHKMTIPVGYHTSQSLSSEKCK